MNYLLRLFFFILFLKPFSIFCQKTVLLAQDGYFYDLKFDEIEVYDDITAKLPFEAIIKKPFFKSTKNSVNSGFSKSKIWYRVHIKNQSKKRWIMSISGTIIDEIELFEVFYDGKIKKRVTGDKYPFSGREVNSPTFAFYLDFKPVESRTLYISVKSNETKSFKLFIRSEPYYFSKLNIYLYSLMFYFGMLLMMVIYNLLLYFSIRDITYLYYVFYIASFSMLQFAVFGLGNQFLWGENTWFGNRSTTFFAGICTVFISLFSYKYLNIKVLFPKLRFAFYYLIISGFLITFVNFIKPTLASNYFAAVISVPNIFLLFLIGFKVLLSGYKPARYYMMAWGILFFSILIFLLNTIFGLTANTYLSLILPVGGLIEVILLSFALGKKIQTTEKEKTNAQKEVVKQLKANEEVRKNIARDLHDDLGSTLSSIRILSEVAHNETNSHPEKLPELLNKIRNSTHKIQENLQDIVWTTQTKDNSIEELLVKIRLFGGEILEAKNINYHLDLDKKLSSLKLEPNIQYDFFMIFKEAINNIIKYAKAKNVFLRINQKNENIEMCIKDDGVGFDINQEKNGNGLKNMPQRAENINGKLSINSKIGEGTEIVLAFPVPQ
jgi:signal transduction histidine kinase